MPEIPQIEVKTKIGRTQNHKSNQTSVTTELSYAKVCSNETEQQMAPRGETQNQTTNEKTPENNNTPNFLNFATYINELQEAAVAEWYRYRIVACLVTSSSLVPLKTRRVGQRCTLNLSRAETSSRWCGVVVRRGGASSGVVHVT
ncbi:uncharacterized protein TNCV_2535171 [Trichonephila clavipes]|nr:uncharacterized protein TNCV_2535171 [Trichonephila clavipes]